MFSVASADGRLTISPQTNLMVGDERWSAVAGGCPDPYPWLVETFAPQAFLEGSGSFVLDDAAGAELPPAREDPTRLRADYLPEQVTRAPDRRGWFTAVDGRGRVRWTIKEWPDPAFAGWHLLVLAHEETPLAYLSFLQRENIPYLVAGRGRVDLELALEKMADLLGVSTVVSTAGGRLNGALIRSGLLDEVVIELFPAVIGGTATPSLFCSPDLEPGQWPTRLSLLRCDLLEAGHVRLHYRVSPA